LVTVIDDSQSVSPAAARASLQLLRDFDAPGRRVAVLGDLQDSGPSRDTVHRKLGDDVVSLCGVDLLVACGERAEDVVAGAISAGMPADRALSIGQLGDATRIFANDVAPGDVLLVSGHPRFSISQLLDQIGTTPNVRVA
jgi:UDP-N-acetylmuramoyl-tripeptide--D-alanyl-D-alanine ligase